MDEKTLFPRENRQKKKQYLLVVIIIPNQNGINKKEIR
jgi:hypothetical protein